MIILRLFFLLCLVSLSNAFSQSKFQPGFIVNLKGDTITGSIDYKRWDRNPLGISFQKEGSQEAKVYHPTDIQSFDVAGEYFESAIVDIDTSFSRIDELSVNSQPAYRRGTVFLQTLVNGEKKLSFLKDQQGKNHFYIYYDQEYQHLVYKQYIKWINEYQKSISENHQYIGQLRIYLQDCSEIQAMLKKTSYDVASLVKLFNTYYKCVDKSPAQMNERKEISVEAGILAGATLSTLSFEELDYQEEGTYSSSISPSLGLFIDFRLMRTRRLTFCNDIFYTSINVEEEDIDPHNSFNIHYLKTHHELRYNLVGSGVFYLSGGISSGLNIGEESQIVVYGSVKEFNSKNFEFGQLISIGSRFGKWGVELKAERSSIAEGSETHFLHFFVRYKMF